MQILHAIVNPSFPLRLIPSSRLQCQVFESGHRQVVMMQDPAAGRANRYEGCCRSVSE